MDSCVFATDWPSFCGAKTVVIAAWYTRNHSHFDFSAHLCATGNVSTLTILLLPLLRRLRRQRQNRSLLLMASMSVDCSPHDFIDLAVNSELNDDWGFWRLLHPQASSYQLMHTYLCAYIQINIFTCAHFDVTTPFYEFNSILIWKMPPGATKVIKSQFHSYHLLLLLLLLLLLRKHLCTQLI